MPPSRHFWEALYDYDYKEDRAVHLCRFGHLVLDTKIEGQFKDDEAVVH